MMTRKPLSAFHSSISSTVTSAASDSSSSSDSSCCTCKCCALAAPLHAHAAKCAACLQFFSTVEKQNQRSNDLVFFQTGHVLCNLLGSMSHGAFDSPSTRSLRRKLQTCCMAAYVKRPLKGTLPATFFVSGRQGQPARPHRTHTSREIHVQGP